ncbi:MAG: hypothetical protein JSS97_20145 [Actinobacteria bacterium]|nr:hypothetical protein [Actinomycetota bacterium]
MLAARNRRFRLAALGAVGWIVVATAFGDEIDWRRLRLGGAIVATTVIAEIGAWVFYLVPTLDRVHIGNFRATYRWTTFASILLAVGAVIIVSGFAEKQRGSGRSFRLWLGMIFATAAYGALTAAQLFLQSFYSAAHAVQEATIAMLILAIGTFGIALAGLVFTLGARRPPARREAALAAAAAGATFASLVLVGGGALLAVAYETHGATTAQDFTFWLGAAYSLGLAAAFTVVALGARTVAVSGRVRA